MAQITYRANLSASLFPMTIAKGGRTVINPQADQNFDKRIDADGQDRGSAGIPQVLYMENVFPTPNGFQSVGYKAAGVIENALAPAPLITGTILYLLHMTGAEGNAVFTDSGPFANTVTTFAGAKKTLINGLPGFGAALTTTGANNSRIELGNANFALAGGDDYTHTFWMRPTTIQSSINIITDYSPITFYWAFNAGRVVFRHAGTDFDCGPVPSIGTWHHYAACRRSGVNYMFADGVLQSTQADVAAFACLVHSITNAPTNDPFNGLIDEVLYLKDQALWIANFTPPELPFAPA